MGPEVPPEVLSEVPPEVPADVPEDELYECEVNNIAKSRHIYSQARRKLSSHKLSSHARGLLAVSAAQRWSHASGAIAHGVRATAHAKATANVMKKLSVTKALAKDQLLHEKFSNLLVRSQELQQENFMSHR